MKFTGHERDLGNLAGDGDDLDYMHARHGSALTGRFLSTDRADVLFLQLGDDHDRRRFHELLAQPQSWNKFSYANNNPMKYTDPDGESAELVIGSPLVFSGPVAEGAAAAAGTGTFFAVGAVVLAGGLGYGIGTALNTIPGVSDTIQDGFGLLLDTIYLAQNNKHNARVASGNLAQALAHIDKIAAAGGPGKDPDFKHHKKEVKTFLDKAKRAADRLPRKLRDLYNKKIRELAQRAGDLQ